MSLKKKQNSQFPKKIFKRASESLKNYFLRWFQKVIRRSGSFEAKSKEIYKGGGSRLLHNTVLNDPFP